MKLICCFTKIHPKTARWARQYPVTFIGTSQSDEAYYDALRSLWGKGSFILIEQDIVPPELRGIAECEQEWCTHPYYVDRLYLTRGLGCVKFSQGLMERHPTLMDELPRGWRSLDAFLSHALNAVGAWPHVHEPDAEHWHGK